MRGRGCVVGVGVVRGRGGHAWQGGGMHGRGEGVRGRRDGHWSGRYASYWNGFLLPQLNSISCNYMLSAHLFSYKRRYEIEEDETDL